MSGHLISTVIVTFNSLPFIKNCLHFIERHTCSPHEEIVVDNASTDGTREFLKGLHSGQTKVILNQANLGYSRGCNQGYEISSGDLVVFLNPDTLVTRNWDLRLQDHIRAGVGGVGPLSNYVAGLQNIILHVKRFPLEVSFQDLAEALYLKFPGKETETKLLMGFCLMVPRKVLEEVGDFDRDLFLGNDDLEFSWRLQRYGYKMVVALDTFVFHHGQASFASVGLDEQCPLVQESTDILYWKLEEHYGEGKVPFSKDLWGMEWFKPSPVPRRLESVVSLIERLKALGESERANRWIQFLAKKKPALVKGNGLKRTSAPVAFGGILSPLRPSAQPKEAAGG